MKKKIIYRTLWKYTNREKMERLIKIQNKINATYLISLN